MLFLLIVIKVCDNVKHYLETQAEMLRGEIASHYVLDLL